MSGLTSNQASFRISESREDITHSLDAIQDSLDAIQKVWDEKELKCALYETPREKPPFPIIATETAGPKHTQSWMSVDSSSSDDVLETPQTEERELDEEEEMVAKIVANLEAKIRAVKKRKRLAVQVESLREELAAKEVELKECDRVLALEMAQVVPNTNP